MTKYVIEGGRYAGVRLEVGRVPRQLIDRFIAKHPEPEPPERKASELGVEVWGDEDQLIKVHGDLDYLRQKAEWHASFGMEMFALLVEAVEIPAQATEEAEAEALDLVALGIVAGVDELTLIANVLASSKEDLNEIVELVLYNSTVTIRGLVEAAQAYNVRWRGKKVPVVEAATGPLKCSGEFGDRLAAQWNGYRWPDFCELPGPEQSEVVAAYRYHNKLQELFAERARKRA